MLMLILYFNIHILFYIFTSIKPVLRSEFLVLENTSYRERLVVLSVNTFETLNLHQQISSIIPVLRSEFLVLENTSIRQ